VEEKKEIRYIFLAEKKPAASGELSMFFFPKIGV